MKRTSHTSHSEHPRRKPIDGLTPADVIAQMTEEAAGGKKLRSVRRTAGKPERQVLPAARPAGAGETGAVRVPGADGGDDGQRADESVQPEVSDRGGETGTQLSRVLKRLLGETAPTELMGAVGLSRVATNAEAVAAVVMREALAGKQWAVEMVRDQTEGKPVRAAQINSNEAEIEDQLDRVSTAALNQIAKRKST